MKEVAEQFKRMSSVLKSDITNIVSSTSACSDSSNDSVSGAKSSSSDTQDRNGFISTACQTDPINLNLFDLISTDEQLKAFTGVTFTTLNLLLKLVLDISDEKCETTMKNRILLTLCKLRLNLSYECLGALVNIDRRRCGEYFASTLHLLSMVLRHTIYWPSKEEIALNMPQCFSKYRNTRVILDCTEVTIISPHCLRCKIRLYSHYKKNHTVKVMVGVAPSGLIVYLSKVYGGRASDNQIFAESEIVTKKLLDPHVDAVMVDKGFRVDKVCTEQGIKIHRPPFIKKKQQLTAAKAKKM